MRKKHCDKCLYPDIDCFQCMKIIVPQMQKTMMAQMEKKNSFSLGDLFQRSAERIMGFQAFIVKKLFLSPILFALGTVIKITNSSRMVKMVLGILALAIFIWLVHFGLSPMNFTD